MPTVSDIAEVLIINRIYGSPLMEAGTAFTQFEQQMC